MAELRFFKCDVCGNVDLELFHGGGQRTCCGQNMVELTANTTDGATEKHVPVITRDGDQVKVHVSTVDHPMLEEHWITLIAVAHGNDYQVHWLNPGEVPEAVFTVPASEKITAYEYCNLHGLWSAEEE